ncbi:bifunctional metallophosphatase/5'-nucleotidase [Lacticaseibacillus daqingensis]|uniref:bifunctional metallophosphatase/5'-nucleotidase n=1 Tax=Lacticaseibacillus daqingensis TaxID=2486014 RepID=UPI000F776FCB|nr:bifunctional UDP-sugar hydrolase/5'-nucleotidase [Lacticaseibacillus daqingensis]
METITLLHTNDLHSHFEHWPKLARYLSAQQGPNVFTFDDGDAMDRAHPLTEATDGYVNVTMLNQAHYTAATIGNNEGLGNSHDQLAHLYDTAQFPVALANLFEPDGTRPAFAQPVVYRTTPAGTRLAIIGFTAPYFSTYAPNGWLVRPVAAVLPELLATIGGTYDVLIMLSHLGLPADRYLATHYPQLDVIIGGHTHHLLPTGEQVDHTLLTAAGRYGEYVGQITLTVDATHRLVTARAQTQAVAALPEAPADAAAIDAWQQQGVAQLAAQPVARLPHALALADSGPSPLVACGLRALQAAGATPAAMLNTGLFLGDLPAGVVTRADLHRILPHPMHLLVTQLSGADLWRLMMEIQKNRAFLRHFRMVGMNFRGVRFGDVQLAGLTLTAKNQVRYAGVPLDFDRQYTLTGVDTYLFAPFFPTLEIAGVNRFLFPQLLRAVVGADLAAHYPLE